MLALTPLDYHGCSYKYRFIGCCGIIAPECMETMPPLTRCVGPVGPTLFYMFDRSMVPAHSACPEFSECLEPAFPYTLESVVIAERSLGGLTVAQFCCFSAGVTPLYHFTLDLRIKRSEQASAACMEHCPMVHLGGLVPTPARCMPPLCTSTGVLS